MKEKFFFKEIEYNHLWEYTNVVEIADIGKPYLIPNGEFVIYFHQIVIGVPPPGLMNHVLNFVIWSAPSDLVCPDFLIFLIIRDIQSHHHSR